MGVRDGRGSVVFLVTGLGYCNGLHHAYIQEALGDTRESFSANQNYMF